MKTKPLAISNVFLLESKVFGDDRGFYFKSVDQTKFGVAIGRHVTFAPDEHLHSIKNFLRSSHCQIQQPQVKSEHAY